MVCGIPGSPGNIVRPFGLRHAVARKRPDGTWRSVATSCGSIALCRECWETYAKPHMRHQKKKGKE